jgi:hypothetical protein
MNKLKENAFEIATGGVLVLLLALVYFLVWQPMSTLGAKQARLEAKTKELRGLNDAKKTPEVPTQAYLELLTSRGEVEKNAISRGIEYYAEKGKKFQLFFEDAATAPDSATFLAAYTDGIRKLREEYQGKFGIKLTDPGADVNQIPPRVSTRDNLSDTDIPVAMKEFWITKAVFDACTALGIGGLQAVDFQGRTAVEKTPHPYYGKLPVQVTVELPFAKIENLVSKLLADERVPLILEELEAKKKAEPMASFKDLAVVHDFKEVGEAKKAAYQELVPEPDVVAVMKFHGLDWKGVPAEAEKKETSEDEVGNKKKK